MDSFRRARAGAEGYGAAEVDAFVAAVEDALAHRPPTMRPEDIHAKVFPIRRMHAAYDEREVDAYLDEAEHRLRAALGEPDPPPERRRVGWLHPVGTAVIALGAIVVVLIAIRAVF